MFTRKLPPFVVLNDPGASGTSTTPPAQTPQTPPAPPADAPSTPEAPQQPTPPVLAPPAGAQAPTQPDPQPGQESAPAAPAPESIDSLPEWAQKEIRDTRREAQGLRQTREAAIAKAKQEAAQEAAAEVAQTIGKALGLIKDEDTPPDPEALVAQAQADREAAAQQARLARLEASVLRSAPSLPVGDALLDSRAFMEQVAAIDPTAEDYAAQVADAVKNAIEANPTRYAVAPAAAPANTGGSPMTGTPPAAGDSVDDFRKDYRASRGLQE